MFVGVSQTFGKFPEHVLPLQSVKDMPVLQDGAPPGGFPSVRFARRIPSTGPTGFTLFALGTVVMAYGFVKVSPANLDSVIVGST